MVTRLLIDSGVACLIAAGLIACDAGRPPEPTATHHEPQVARASEQLELTWVVYPEKARGWQPVMLEYSTDGTRAVNAGSVIGWLHAVDQSACGRVALGADEVAALTFYEYLGTDGFVVRRSDHDLTVFRRTEDKTKEIAVTEKQVAKVWVGAPPTAKVIQRIVEVDASGHREPFDCRAR